MRRPACAAGAASARRGPPPSPARRGTGGRGRGCRCLSRCPGPGSGPDRCRCARRAGRSAPRARKRGSSGRAGHDGPRARADLESVGTRGLPGAAIMEAWTTASSSPPRTPPRTARRAGNPRGAAAWPTRWPRHTPTGHVNSQRSRHWTSWRLPEPPDTNSTPTLPGEAASTRQCAREDWWPRGTCDHAPESTLNGLETVGDQELTHLRDTRQSRTLIRLSSHPCMRTHLLGDVAAPVGSNDVAAGPGDAA
ncbi:hypothetical protein SUDANB174_00089 [Streptomyces sp. enrichment culture]